MKIKLTIGELISIYRTRKGLTQKDLGKIVFGDLKTPNVKVKKIEKGQQTPKSEELEKIADALDQPLEVFFPREIDYSPDENKNKEEGYYINKKIDRLCPQFPKYIEAINSLAEVDGMEIIANIMEKMCSEFVSKKKT